MGKKENNSRFEYMLNEALSKVINENPKDEEFEEIVFSKEHQKKMKKIIQKAKAQYMVKKVNPYLKRIAIIMIVIVICSGFLLFGVEAYRVKFLNYFIKQKDRYYEISFNPNYAYYNELINIKDIPDDFKLTREETSETSIYLKFESTKNNKYFVISAEKEEGVIQVDTENSEIKYLVINQKKLMIIEKENRNSIYWNDDKYIYLVYGNIESDELIKIVKNVE